MRVLFISKCSPLKEGGAETRSKEVAFRLARLGHDVTIFCGKTHIAEPEFAEEGGVKVIHKKILPDWLIKRFPYPSYVALAAASLFLMFPLYFFLRKERFDFVREDFAPFPPSGLLALKKLKSSTRVTVAHNLQPDLKGWLKFYGPAYGFAGYVMYRLLRAGRMKYDRIICVARFLADDLKRHPRIGDRVSYVPNGINLADFKSNGDKAKPNGSGHIRLLSVGRVVELKGFRYAIEALAHLKDEYPQARLDILGSGPEQEPLKRLAYRFGVSHMVEFRPPVGYCEMPGIYSRYHFFVMPSLTEGLPMVLIEAMASHLPVVATDIPAVTSILDQQSATLCSRADAADLARKLRWAFEHPQEVSRAADRAHKIAQGFNWDLTVKQEVECHQARR